MYEKTELIGILSTIIFKTEEFREDEGKQEFASTVELLLFETEIVASSTRFPSIKETEKEVSKKILETISKIYYNLSEVQVNHFNPKGILREKIQNLFEENEPSNYKGFLVEFLGKAIFKTEKTLMEDNGDIKYVCSVILKVFGTIISDTSSRCLSKKKAESEVSKKILTHIADLYFSLDSEIRIKYDRRCKWMLKLHRIQSKKVKIDGT